MLNGMRAAALPVESPWGLWRARIICLGSVAWLGGVNSMLLNFGDDVLWVAGWLVSASGFLVAGATLLSAAVWRAPTRWAFPRTVLAVPRKAGVPPSAFFILLAVLVAGVPVLMAVLMASLFS